MSYQHAIYRIAVLNHRHEGNPTLHAHSSDVAQDEVNLWHTSRASHLTEQAIVFPMLALWAWSTDFHLVMVTYAWGDAAYIHYLKIPTDDLNQLNLPHLVEWLPSLPYIPPNLPPLKLPSPPLALPLVSNWGVLNSLITHGQIAIPCASMTYRERLVLANTLLRAVPSSLYHTLALTTVIPPRMNASAFRIRFQEDAPPHDPSLPLHPYIAWLQQNALDPNVLNPLLVAQSVPSNPFEPLTWIVKHYQHRQRFLNQDNITLDELEAWLTETPLAPTDWLDDDVEALFEQALVTRETRIYPAIVQQLERSELLSARLAPILERNLKTCPDCVYGFMRIWASGAVELAPDFLDTLWASAQSALEVAIATRDAETILSWLRLIAREPAYYQLGEVLRAGIRQTVPLAYHDEHLAQRLIVLTVRFAVEMVEELLNDASFIIGLPSAFQNGLTHGDPQGLAEIRAVSNKLFLVAMQQALKHKHVKAFEQGGLTAVLELDQAETPLTTEPPYRPRDLVMVCIQHGCEWLSGEVLIELGRYLLVKNHRVEFRQLCENLAKRRRLVGLLPQMLAHPVVGVNRMVDTFSMIFASEILPAQDLITLVLRLLDEIGWNKETSPLMEMLVRVVEEYPNQVQVLPETYFTLMTNAEKLNREDLAQFATLQLLHGTREMGDEGHLPRAKQVFEQINWSASAVQVYLKWYREFANQQSTARLNALLKGLNGARIFEPIREVLHGILAVRRVMGKMDLANLSQQVDLTYHVLLAFSEAFDPEQRSVKIDLPTVECQLKDLTKGASIQEREILADSLVRLATLISTLSDKRTKPGIGRRAEEVDRQLMSGKQEPVSALDMMKWMAGYLHRPPSETPQD